MRCNRILLHRQKKDCNDDELFVRALVFDDLKRLGEKLTPPATAIIETPMADYRY